MISPITKSNVAEAVFDKMLSMIATEEWKAGQKIPSENELKECFEVSRNTVRQAIQKLNALGVLEAKQGEGTFVKKIDTSFYINVLVPSAFLGNMDCMKVLEFEKSIQVESVKLVGQRATMEEIEGLKYYIEEMKKQTDPDLFFESDIEYHKYMSKITHNEMFYKSMNIIKDLLHGGLRQVVIKYGSNTSIEFHEKIYNLLKERRTAEAAEQMDIHMGDVVDKLYHVLCEKGEEGEMK